MGIPESSAQKSCREEESGETPCRSKRCSPDDPASTRKRYCRVPSQTTQSCSAKIREAMNSTAKFDASGMDQVEIISVEEGDSSGEEEDADIADISSNT